MLRAVAVACFALLTVTVAVPSLIAATTISSFAPTSGVPGTVVTISGSDLLGTSVVTFNGVPAAFSVLTSGTITVAAPDGATTGPITLQSSSIGGTAISTNPWTIAAPAIASVDPARDVAGYAISIFGMNFTGTTGVTFNGTPVTWTVVSNNQIYAHIPLGVSASPITVTTAGGAATSSTRYTIASGLLVNPDFDTAVTGWNTGSRECTATKCVYPPLNFEYHWNFFQDADQSPSSGALDTTNIGTQATLGLNQCVAATPNTRYSVGMRTLIPTGQAKVGKSELRIYWHPDSSCNSAYINPIEGVETTVTNTWQTVSMNRTSPAGTGSIEVYLGNWPTTVPDNFRVFFDNVYLDVEHVPTISGFTPAGPVTAGSWVTIDGIDFYGTSAVRFNGVTSQAFEVKNQRKIVAMAPSGAYTGPISVVTPGGTGFSSTQLTIISAPSINIFSPTSGPRGSLVVIYGNNLDTVTQVSFNSVPASFIIVLPFGLTPYIQATVPMGATTGQIMVMNPAGGIFSGNNFVVLLPRADFNADGQADVVLRNYTTGQNAVWLMSGTAVTSIVDLPALSNTNYRIEGTADFNNDAQTDIVLRNYLTGQDALWLMNGTMVSSIVDLPALANTDYHIEGTGDFNADGKPDLILRNYVTGQNAVWLMNGTSVSTVVDLPLLANTAYKIESCGDFNNDGKPDIVLRNYSTGQNALWLMSGTTVTAIVDLPALPNSAYRIDAIGDFNADGKPDIVWRNYTTGQNAVWIMSGTAVSSIIDLPALPNTAYEINGPR